MCPNNITDRIWNRVQSLNRARTLGVYAEEVADIIHEKIISVSHTEHLPINGREDFIAAWNAMSEKIRIHNWTEIDPEIHLYSDNQCAVVSYFYEITCEVDGESRTMNGREMLVLAKEGGRWQVVADQLYPVKQ